MRRDVPLAIGKLRKTLGQFIGALQLCRRGFLSLC
jgi:hypothetical protein